MGVISNSDAFLTGHHLSYSSVYFDQVLLAAKLSNLPDQNAQQHAKNMIQNLQRMGTNFARRIQFVNHISESANLPVRALPALPPDFYPWANHRHQEFLEFWPATHTGGCLFVIGHAIGEIRNGLIIANLTLDFESHLGIDGNRQRESIPPRILDSLNRWNKALQILETSEPDSEVVLLLRTLFDGLQIQINTSLKLMVLENGKEKCLTLHHKILQILGSTEIEIQQLLK